MTIYISRWRFFLCLIAALAVAGFIVTKAYQKNFSHKALTEAEQTELQVTLLSFPRNMSTLTEKDNHWRLFYVTPVKCGTVCQTNINQLQVLTAPVNVLLINPDHQHYQEIRSLVDSQNYAEHLDKVLLINPQGQFAGSISAPYSQERMIGVFQTLIQ